MFLLQRKTKNENKIWVSFSFTVENRLALRYTDLHGCLCTGSQCDEKIIALLTFRLNYFFLGRTGRNVLHWKILTLCRTVIRKRRAPSLNFIFRCTYFPSCSCNWCFFRDRFFCMFSSEQFSKVQIIINMVVRERNFRYGPLICPVQTPLQ